MTFDMSVLTTTIAGAVTAFGGIGGGVWLISRTVILAMKEFLVLKERISSYIDTQEKRDREVLEWMRSIENRVSQVEQVSAGLQERTTRMDENLIGRISLHGVKTMSPELRKQLIDWIRKQADELEKHWDSLSDHFTMRFMKHE